MEKPKAQVRPKKTAKADTGVAPQKKKDDAASLKPLICQKLAEGMPLREICRTYPGMPAWRTVYDWMDVDQAFATAIARARNIGHDAIAEQTIDLIDAVPERGRDGKIDPGWVAHQKLRAEHRLKLLAKWNPKRYGDKVTNEHTGANGGAIQVESRVTFVRPAPRVED